MIEQKEVIPLEQLLAFASIKARLAELEAAQRTHQDVARQEFVMATTRYRSRPTEVDAEQWFPGKDVRGVHAEPVTRIVDGVPDYRHFVVTIHGDRAFLAPGDYIITEPDGIHHYPCKPDIFEKKYSPAQ